MAPRYQIENRYSYHVGSWASGASGAFVTATPQGEFQQHLQDLYVKGHDHLRNEEYALALQAFEETSALILHTVNPSMPIGAGTWRSPFPLELSLVDTLIGKSAEMLRTSDTIRYVLPGVAVSSVISGPAQQALRPFVETGLQITSFHAAVTDRVNEALDHAAHEDWPAAIKSYQQALEQTPATEGAIRAGFAHDLAVLSDKAGDRAGAQNFGQQSIDGFAAAHNVVGQAQALAATAGILTRAGNAQKAAEFGRTLDALRTTNNLNPVLTPVTPVVRQPLSLRSRVQLQRPTIGATPTVTEAAPLIAPPQFDQAAPELMGMRFIVGATPQKTLTVRGTATQATIVLDAATGAANMKSFLTTLSQTDDIGLLTRWHWPVHFVAYIPHLYFFLLPMSIGDCYAGMGDLPDARDAFKSVLVYPFINRNAEIVKVWTRLAQTFLDIGDAAYRDAKDNVAGFAAAQQAYASIVRANGTLDPASSLYADAKFGGIRARVTAFLANANPLAVDDNPAITSLVHDALTKQRQIAAGLNVFGYSPDYSPPFSFEYLQSTARYFAQQASQTEQRYIQYKSQGENEQFRRDQLAQQAEVARQSVILEQLGVAEADRGIEVANAGLAYAVDQVQSATAAKNDFANARWEMLELTELDAWASASSVDKGQEVKLTISNYDYYSADHKPRNQVLQDLAYQRTLLSQNLEDARLGRAITSAQSYQQVAQAQLGQAQARRDSAQQRVQVAQLQQRQAEENRDFLDMREFGAQLWYELAQQARRLKQRYLDMATGIAFLMERAYNAETERGLSVIRYDYQHTSADNLMGADQLLADVDYFTYDHITTTKTKKNPVKKVISLADRFPWQFNKLKTTGVCRFETSLTDFDREQPGLYLAKTRNVELKIIGLSGTASIAGTLRNLGVSRFRRANGKIVERLYPADVMVLSQYDLRQDVLLFRFNPTDLRLFENNGIETMWRLELPLGANDLDYADILDVQLILYYDGFFDRTLETAIRAQLPATGSAARAISLKFSAPDEFFYLQSQGEAELAFDATMFPRTQTNLVRSTDTIRLAGKPDSIRNLTIRLASTVLGAELVLKTDNDGVVKDKVAGAPLGQLMTKPVLDRWKLRITAEDNPTLVHSGALDLSGLDDVQVFFEYTFAYR